MSIAAASLLVAGCTGESLVVVNLRTDLRSPDDFDQVRVFTDHPNVGEEVVSIGDHDARTLLDGIRLADLSGLSPGPLLVAAELLRGDETAMTVRSRIQLDVGATAVTLLATRSCLGVGCGEEETCINGACQSGACFAEEIAECSVDQCEADADCSATGGPSCVVGRCVDGVCFDHPDDSRCGDSECDLVNGCSDWWDSQWRQRRAVYLDHEGAALDDFVVLVPIGPDVMSSASENASDIRFVDEAGQLLPSEISEIRSEGASAWVRLSRVESNVEDSRFWLYWDSDSALPIEDATAVWEEYAAVLHFDRSTVVDVSAAGTLTAAENVTYTQGGVSGTALRFAPPERAAVRLAAGPQFDFGTELTMSIWVRETGLNDESWHALISRARGTTAEDVLWLGSHNQEHNFHVWTETGQLTPPRASVEPFAAPTWNQITLVVGPTMVRYFLNGSELDSMARAIDAPIETTDNDIILGGDTQGGPGVVADFVDAEIDEVRIVSRARSAAWVQAQYESERGSLLRFGAVEAF